MEAVRPGLPLFHTTRAGRVIEWNPAAEELTGVPAGAAVGRDCWEVIRGRDARGGLVCRQDCSVPRRVRAGTLTRCGDLRVELPSGVGRLTVSTIVVGSGDDAVVLHPMQVLPHDTDIGSQEPRGPELTPRQHEILFLLAEGVASKQIALRLSLSLSTVKNHIRLLLQRLHATSRLEAVAKARELGLLDRPFPRAPARPPR
jgi:DNA-binding CsgD family transcriptional regulator